MRFTIRSRLSTSLASFVIFVLGRYPAIPPFVGGSVAKGPCNLSPRPAHQGVLPRAAPKLSNSARLPHRPPLNPPLIQLTLENTLHIHAGRVNLIPIQLARFHQMLHFGNRHLSRRRHHGIKIPRRLSVNQIPQHVTLPSLHEGKVSIQPALHHVRSPIELSGFFSFRRSEEHP